MTMRVGGTLIIGVALSLTLSGCLKAPPRPPLLSDAEIGTIAGTCNVSPKYITATADKIRFDPPKNLSRTQKGCVLKELRNRLPHAAIDYPLLGQKDKS